MNSKEKYELWLSKVDDKELLDELKKMDDEMIEDSFYKDLSFGTGGLRGTIGAGSNRMNIYTVRKASQGLANYLNKHYANPSIVIGYDSRIKSDVFSKCAAKVFSDNGIKVYLWDRLLPVPTVSFGVRYMRSSAGVMITASHNPSKYNGYKVYGSDGCQITTKAAEEILSEIEKVDIFEGVVVKDLNNISSVPEECFDKFIENVKSQSVLFDEKINKDVKIVYSPLNGTGREPVLRVLKEAGFTNVKVVTEQEYPDGNFPTCPYPNPEIKEAMALGMEYAKKDEADLLIATDPDCDRVGIAVRNNDGEYVLLSGNETGILLLDYICSQRIKHNKMPSNAVAVKTIVSTDLADSICKHYGVSVRNVLTGFKFIGEQIGLLEKDNKQDCYIFGFEESYGYLTGSYVRDKDGVDGAFMICEMYAYYKTLGISLLDKLDDLYRTYGYQINSLGSYEFDGSSGFKKMQDIMASFRNKPLKQINGIDVEKCLDYSLGLDGLPKSDVLKYYLADKSSVVVRPSGTEPKLKTYVSTLRKTKEESIGANKELADSLKGFFK